MVQCVVRRLEPVLTHCATCHSGQTHRFRCCLSAAVGAIEYPKKISRNGNKEELYFTYLSLTKFMDPVMSMI